MINKYFTLLSSAYYLVQVYDSCSIWSFWTQLRLGCRSSMATKEDGIQASSRLSKICVGHPVHYTGQLTPCTLHRPAAPRPAQDPAQEAGAAAHLRPGRGVEEDWSEETCQRCLIISGTESTIQIHELLLFIQCGKRVATENYATYLACHHTLLYLLPF